MQINSIQTNKSTFGQLQINDSRISKNYQKAIQYELKNEIKKLDKQGFDVVLRHEPYSLETFDAPSSDVFLKSKADKKELYISTLNRDTNYSFKNSLNNLKEILSVLS